MNDIQVGDICFLQNIPPGDDFHKNGLGNGVEVTVLEIDPAMGMPYVIYKKINETGGVNRFCCARIHLRKKGYPPREDTCDWQDVPYWQDITRKEEVSAR